MTDRLDDLLFSIGEEQNGRVETIMSGFVSAMRVLSLA